MSSVPEDLKYSKTHEWIRMGEDFIGTCGITDHAQEMLTDIVFVELPEISFVCKKGDRVGLVESVKSVSDLYAPVSGTIIETNSAIEDSPELVNSDPYGKGWLFKIDVKFKTELDDLMSPEEYNGFVESGQ